MEIDDIPHTALYNDILKFVYCEELKLSLEAELMNAYENYDGGWDWDWNNCLDDAFEWSETPQGHGFWRDIADFCTPKGYK